MRRVAQVIRAGARLRHRGAHRGTHVRHYPAPGAERHGEPHHEDTTAIEKEVDLQRQSGGAQTLQVSFSHMTFPDDGIDGEQLLTRLEQQN